MILTALAYFMMVVGFLLFVWFFILGAIFFATAFVAEKINKGARA